MTLSVIIATRTRAAGIERLLALAAAWRRPAGSAEIVVVDNGSTDGTPDVLRAARAASPLPVVLCREETPGLSNARNAGIRAAGGQVLLFTDDDVIPESDWLVAVEDVARRMPHLAFGGRVTPEWQAAPPRWLRTSGPCRIVGGAVVSYDHGDRERECDETMYVPAGACMFFRREAFERHGGFRADLGRVAGEVLSADDSEMFFRLRAAGERILYAPSVRVRHPVDPARMTKAYHRRWYAALGRSNARMDGPTPGARHILGFPGFAIREVLRETSCLLGACVMGPPGARFFRELRLRAALERAREHRRIARARREAS
jgi:glycosyltransferase involved in cell wall biosynthesis